MLLAILFLAIIDVAVTRTQLLWGHLSWENSIGGPHVLRYQTFQVARKLFYGSPDDAALRVVLLGDSRIWFAGHAPYVEGELRRLTGNPDVRVENLAIWGSRIGDLEALSRHLYRLKPSAVVVAMGPSMMLPRPEGLGTFPASILDLGWRDGPLPQKHLNARLDRWLRTAWPFYRFRDFVRLAIADRFAPNPYPFQPLPDQIPDTLAFFKYWFGARASEVDGFYWTWRTRPTLATFAQYLAVARRRPMPGELAGGGTSEAELAWHSAAERLLERLFEQLERGPWSSLVLLMPENPILREDTAGKYHIPRRLNAMSDLIQDTARRSGMRVVDGRRWMPAAAFFDFSHVFPDISGFQQPLAKEIVSAITSNPPGPTF